MLRNTQCNDRFRVADHPGAVSRDVVDRDAKWTFNYSNAAVPAQGVDGGAGGGANNGRVTYTATIP